MGASQAGGAAGDGAIAGAKAVIEDPESAALNTFNGIVGIVSNPDAFVDALTEPYKSRIAAGDRAGAAGYLAAQVLAGIAPIKSARSGNSPNGNPFSGNGNKKKNGEDKTQKDADDKQDVGNEANDAAPNAQTTARQNAGNGVGALYRGDGRPRDEIFDDGIQPWDKDGNLDLERHVNTDPSPTENNPWVSTSKDKEIADDFARQNGGDVYVIDGNTPNQVDVNETLGRDNVRFPRENEVAIDGGIPSCNIKGCYDGKTGEFIENPNYNPRGDN